MADPQKPPNHRNPFHDLSPEDQEKVRQAIGEKFERDVAVATEVAKRVSKAAIKIWLEPKVNLAMKIYKAIVDEK